MTDPLGQSQVLPYLKGLSKNGYTIHLVSYEKPDKFKKYRNHIQEICDESGIKWHPQDYVLGGSIIDTIKQVRRMQKIAFYLNSKYNFSIVHCRSYISALAGLKLKRRKGLKFIFDMRGFWADERIDGKLWSLKNPLYKFIYSYFKRKELQFFKESDCTISLTKNGENEIKTWNAFKNDPPNIKVIPCCVDLNLFNPNSIDEVDKNRLRNALGIKPDEYILGYIGSIGTWYMLSEMLDYFKVLKGQNPTAKFMFVTGEKPESIIHLAEEKRINVKDLIITSVLHDQVPLNISLFSKSIFFIRATYSKKASSPTKQGEIMAMGIPLICNSGVGDTDSIVLKYHSGKVIQEFSQEAYLKSILNGEKFDSESISKGAKDYFSLDEGVNRYLSVYKDLNE
jgi:glycosyltransferase involved in cell wall biosynthesis